MTEITADEQTFCSVHPDRETGLRCNRCERYMCAQCAVSTPVGYRCRECVRQVEDKFFTGRYSDYVSGIALSAGATMAVTIAGSAIGLIHMWIVGFFLGVVFGGLLSQMLLWTFDKRRGRHTGKLAAAGVVIGAGIAALITGALVSLGLWLFAGVTASVVYGRFR